MTDNQRERSTVLVVIIWYPASPSRIIVLLKTQPLIVVKEIKATRIDHTSERRRQNLVTCILVHVAAFRCKAEWINETAPMWTKGHKYWKKSSNSWLWNVVRVWFFLKDCCNHRPKRIEAVRFHHISCGSWHGTSLTKVFVYIRSHNRAIMCLFDRTEDRIWTTIGNFYAAQKQDYCSEEFTILVC